MDLPQGAVNVAKNRCKGSFAWTALPSWTEAPQAAKPLANVAKKSTRGRCPPTSPDRSLSQSWRSFREARARRDAEMTWRAFTVHSLHQ